MITKDLTAVAPAPSYPPPVDEARPTRLKMTYEEFREWADEDVHAEWVDGEVIIQMPPKDQHQRIVGYLHHLLGLFIQLVNWGVVRVAPFEMRLREGRPAWEPDILALKRENLSRLTEDRLEGPADLVIEVISPDSIHRDRDKKFQAYQADGVPEYWIIDSRPNRQRADFYRLDENGVYRLFATEDDEKVSSTVLPGFWLKPAWLWAEDAPNPLEALYEMAGVSGDLIAQMRAALQQGLQS